MSRKKLLSQEELVRLMNCSSSSLVEGSFHEDLEGTPGRECQPHLQVGHLQDPQSGSSCRAHDTIAAPDGDTEEDEVVIELEESQAGDDGIQATVTPQKMKAVVMLLVRHLLTKTLYKYLNHHLSHHYLGHQDCHKNRNASFLTIQCLQAKDLGLSTSLIVRSLMTR